MTKIKGWLITGLLVFIPFWATAVVVYKAFGFLDGWSKYVGINVPGVGLVTLLGGLLLIGMLTRNYVGKKLHELSEWIMLKIPLVNKVYATIKEVSKTLLNHDKSAFQEVVAIEFAGHKTIGFVTGEVPEKIEDAIRYNWEHDRGAHKLVYVMQAFSPAAGFIMMISEDKLSKVDMSIEAAMKLVLTGGMVKDTSSAPEAAEGFLKLKDGVPKYRVIVSEINK